MEAADGSVRHLNIRASQWMKQGIALLEENTSESLERALVLFEQAIEIRSSLPISEDPWIRYGLAAGWMNRGDVLTRMGNPGKWREAIRSYDRALTLMDALPPGRHILFRKRHAIAWMNRGIALMRLETASGFLDAQDSFQRAAVLLAGSSAGDDPDFPGLCAAVRLNLAGVLLRLDPPRPREALRAARAIIALAGHGRLEQVTMAEVSVKARQLVCQAISMLLDEPGLSSQERHDLLDEATEQVEEGLELVHAWRNRGHAELESAGHALFRFGAFAYNKHQPRFLNEFLKDHLQNSGARERVLQEMIRLELGRLGREQFPEVDSPAFQALLARLSFIREYRNHLAGIRHKEIPGDRL